MPERRLEKTREAYRGGSQRREYFSNLKEVPCEVCGDVFWADLWGDQAPPYFCHKHLNYAPWRSLADNTAERLKQAAYRISQRYLTQCDPGDENTMK